MAEDGARRLMPQGVLASLPNDGGLEYSLNAWTAGSFRMWDSDSLVGRLNDDLGPSPLAVGHHVSTMTVAMAIGLGIVLWRTRNPVGRVAAWVVPVAAFVQVVVDHAAYNASVAALGSVSWLDSDDAVLSWLGAAWQLSGRGGDEIAYSLVLFGLCLLADARRRLRTGVLGVTAGEAPRASLLTVIGGPAFVRAPIEAVVALVVLSYSDLAVIARGYTDWRMTRPRRMIEGRLTAAQVMETRRDAMAATTPGVEPAARWALAVLALTVSAVVGLLCLWCGVVAAQAIGSSLLFGDSDSAFFAGLLDELATWWDLLGPTGQILVTALGVTLLMTTGSTFTLAMGATGVLTWDAPHGHGLASYLNNPAAANAMRQGGKEATQATEQTAARTETQHVAESQAAHTRATRVKQELPKTGRNRPKVVSSDRNNDALSGWSKDRPPGFLDPNVEEVLQVTDEMGHPRTPYFRDQGVPGDNILHRMPNDRWHSMPNGRTLAYLRLCAKIVKTGSEVWLNISAETGMSPTLMGHGYSEQTGRSSHRPDFKCLPVNRSPEFTKSTNGGNGYD